MPLEQYRSFNFRKNTLDVIRTANDIIREYSALGYDLTLRQLYYQFVARDIIPNSDREYKKLGSAVNDGRLAGMIDWEAIIDRTRPSRGNSHWESPQAIISTCASQFRIDTRSDQEKYIEVWVEKDALVGVLEKICTELDVPYFSCRGYVSQSSMWEAAQRFVEQEDNGRSSLLIHLGDHDPSGIDMTRDIQSRLDLFGSGCEVMRIALTKKQIKQYNPPPNPTKLTDSRCAGYIEAHGESSWELDALEPQVISELIENTVDDNTDLDKRDALIEEQKQHRSDIRKVSNNWEDIVGDL